MNDDTLSKLERLAKLKEQGAITDSEYEYQKAAILGNPGKPIILENPKKSGCLPWLIIGVILLFVVLAGGGAFDTKVPDSEMPRSEKLSRLFSGYDGSHGQLESNIKSTMNDPDSYEHVKTTYFDNGETLLVVTTFRGKNAFGGVITNSAEATISSDDGHIIDWKMR